LSQAQRTTILELSAQGVSKHEIARMLGISRLTVRKVVRSNFTEVPEIPRAEKAEPYRQRILELFSTCKENLVRVHEELTAEGAALSYPALTAFLSRMRCGSCSVTTTCGTSGDHNSGTGVTRSGDGDGTTAALSARSRRGGRIGPAVGPAWWSPGANTDPLRNTFSCTGSALLPTTSGKPTPRGFGTHPVSRSRLRKGIPCPSHPEAHSGSRLFPRNKLRRWADAYMKYIFICVYARTRTDCDWYRPEHQRSQAQSTGSQTERRFMASREFSLLYYS
jgi:predicted transcriptional regulator